MFGILRLAFLRMTLAATFAVAGSIGPVRAQTNEVVDVELVFAVDISRSISMEELAIQRDGYAAALTDPSVLEAIADGLHQKIAITYVEWSGVRGQRTIVPWTVIAKPADAVAIANFLRSEIPASGMRTSISSAIDHTSGLFEGNGISGMKRVIDISGDGPNNQGGPVLDARDAAIAKGIIINGLPLLTNSGPFSEYDLPNLDEYYANCVIGGPGSFMVPVTSWEQFPAAVRRKLILELADGSRSERLPVVLAAGETGYDCLIGEKMWGSRYFLPDNK
jgi:hypothetical protein